MYEGVNNYVNKPKIFRIAEQYLIAAEAYYMRGEGEDELAAYDVLYELMYARDASISFNPVSGLSLRHLIRAERERELYGEGFRLTDLNAMERDSNVKIPNQYNYLMSSVWT